ncbi:unnamed protein product [Urochloa decumbens]|uniref:Uncharacterized protein n=1 Tax=Urochloa decumbens TaxID=240449 RepID=A0ABC8W636_9POAL
MVSGKLGLEELMAVANGEPPAQEGGGRVEAEGEEDMDDEAAFFSLEVALTCHRSAGLDHHHEDKDYAGHKGIIDGRELVAAAEALHRRERVAAVEAFRRGDAASSEAALGSMVRPMARLRALVRKLWKPKAAGPAHPSGSAAAAVAELEDSRFMVSGAEVAVAGAADAGGGGHVVALKYLTSKVRNRPQQQAAANLLLPGRKSRGESETGLRQACRRRLGIARSPVSEAAFSPPPTPPHRDDSLLQAQDGVASAIAYCKLSLTPSRGFGSPVVPFCG